MGKFKDLSGERFGRLTPIKYIGKSKWTCKCDCGNTIDVFTQNLKRGNTRSCGCLNKQLASKRAKKHGLCGSKVYQVAENIIQRCINPKNSSYPNYGGRGVKIYPLWRDNVGLFARWLLNNGWYDGCEVDKDIKSNGKIIGYFPNTISFIDPVENKRHKRNIIDITYNGKTQPLKTWCIELNLPYRTIFCRYKYLGWKDPVTLFETPIKVGNNQTLRGDKH